MSSEQETTHYATGLLFDRTARTAAALTLKQKDTKPQSGAPTAFSKAEGSFMATDDSKKYVGMWVTPDGHIRQELLPNGRYDEARGNKRSAYQGRYEISGNHIEYWDDTGFTASGDFIDGALHHIGMEFHRE